MKLSFGFLRNIIAVFLLSAVFLVFGAGSAAALNNGAEPRTTYDYYYSDDSTVGPTPTSNWTCTVNGQQTDCADAKKTIGGVFLVLMIVFFAFLAIIGIIFFVIWLVMLIHAISNPIEDKALWIILMVFVGTLASVVYYFVVKRPFDKKNKHVKPNGDAVNTTASAPITVENNAPKVAAPIASATPLTPEKSKKAGSKTDKSTKNPK